MRAMAAWLRRHPELALALAGAGVYLVGLGASDLKEWDEALYALRTLAILRDGQWLDQTAQAFGGFWTSVHPPLTLWLTALGCRLLGLSEWTLRLPSALAGAGCLLLAARLARRLAGDRATGLLAAAGLLLLPVFTRFVRLGQLDAPVLFWLLLCLLLFLKGRDGRGGWFAASGAALGLGLLSKVIVAALAPLSLALWLAWEALRRDGPAGRRRRDAAGLALAVAIGLLLAAPWFAFMTARHGAEFWRQCLGYHVLARLAEPLEGHGSALGPLYWPHEVVKKFGALLPLVVLGLHAAHARGALAAGPRRFLLSWLLVPLLVFTVAATKSGQYLLLFVVPLACYLAVGARALGADRTGPRAEALVLPGAAAALAWSQTAPLQRGLEAALAAARGQGEFPAPAALGILAFLAAAAAAGALAVDLHARLGSRGRARWRAATLGFTALAALATAGTPLRRGDASWIAVSARVRAAAPARVAVVGEDSAVNRYYLRALGDAATPGSRLVAPSGSPAGDVATAPVVDEAAPDLLVVQRLGADTPPAPPACEAVLTTPRLILYRRWD